MRGLLAFMERWKPGSTQGFEPATAEQIAALAKPHGGLNALPRVYREFLETMGASTGNLRLKAGTTSISALLEDREDPQRERPDARRYLKFTIGEEHPEERYPDDFFDLTHPTPDGRDAAIIRVHEEDLVRGKGAVEQAFPTFSDWLRTMVIARVVFATDPEEQTQYYNLGPKPETPARTYEFFTRIGFSLTELGASLDVVPLEHPERGAIALVSAPSTSIPRTGVELRARDKSQQALLNEVIEDHKQELSGG
ncbi:SMI1/KNR4 family protein [Vitiosangium sp. GDMCC 1.1324]|uniref:SMI1/KNR4 family protein n=1 Tax=Vitiosangium sp. (strain GDMCC 1.1324) TaxID=2138576 RepID=UPI001E2C0EBF|nr:SMI1/KNR4 family protein [Vitiosangium sp. GDMCC 1.1324]